MTQVTAASIIGTPFGLAWALALTIALLRRSDVYNFESPVRQWRWEEVAGPGAIRFSLFGYQAARVLRPAGVSRLTYSGTPAGFDLGSMADDPTVGGQGPDDDDEAATGKRGDDEPERGHEPGHPADGPEAKRGGRK